MRDLLEFFSLEDVVPLSLLICLLQFVGGQMSAGGGDRGTDGDDPAPRWWARGVAAAAFLTYAALAVAEWDPTTPSEFLELGLRAVLAMGTAHGLARVTVPAVRFAYLYLWAKPRERERLRIAAQVLTRQAAAEWAERDAAERRQRAEEERKAAEEQRRRQEELANRPPPPTREERMAAARQKYESTLKTLAGAGLDDTELRAAREAAKQAYLRDLDEAMKS